MMDPLPSGHHTTTEVFVHNRQFLALAATLMGLSACRELPHLDALEQVTIDGVEHCIQASGHTDTFSLDMSEVDFRVFGCEGEPASERLHVAHDWLWWDLDKFDPDQDTLVMRVEEQQYVEDEITGHSYGTDLYFRWYGTSGWYLSNVFTVELTRGEETWFLADRDFSYTASS